jgi:hypothetical protein
VLPADAENHGRRAGDDAYVERGLSRVDEIKRNSRHDSALGKLPADADFRVGLGRAVEALEKEIQAVQRKRAAA